MSALVRPYRGISPRIHPTAFIAETAVIIGDVEIGAGASIWYGCVLRGDVNRIVVGEGTNLQDGTIVHCNRDESGADYRVSGGGMSCIIGRHITVGHMALLHACTLEDGCFVGMRAVVMDGAVVESGAMIAAGALVSPGKRVLAGEVWAGQPAKPWRAVTAAEKDYFVSSPRGYAELAAGYLAEGKS